MSLGPIGQRVGGEALVENDKGGRELAVFQIEEELPYLGCVEEALVSNGTTRPRTDVEIFNFCFCRAPLGNLGRKETTAFKFFVGDGRLSIRFTRNDRLPNVGPGEFGFLP